MRRRTMIRAVANDAGDLNLCNVILYDKNSNKLVQTSKFAGLNKDMYEPVGIVVIPTSHDVYGTGECGVMALMSASLTTPDTGQNSNTYMYWGAYGTDYPELVNYDKVCKVGIESGTQKNNAIVNNEPTTLTGYSYLPSDKNVADSQHTKAVDGTYYHYNDSDWNNCLPSPYLVDGSRNPAYYQTGSPSSTVNALSDFAGKSNTEFLCSKATAQESWRTDASITNNSGAGYHPAACACWRYHTLGTSQGDWYLPACGELGYVYVRYKLINETITALQTWSGKTYCSLIAHSFWSSSEYSSYYARYVGFYNGYVGYYGRSTNYYVRPFLRGQFEFLHGA